MSAVDLFRAAWDAADGKWDDEGQCVAAGLSAASPLIRAAGFREIAQTFAESYHQRFSGTDVAAILRAAAAELEEIAEPTDDGFVLDEDPRLTVQAIVDLLSLVDAEIPGGPVTADEVEQWQEADAVAVIEWAGAVHLSASDNDDVEIPDMPEVLARRDVPVEVQPCPECRAGKHVNCTGSYDFEKDEAAPCPCAEVGHPEAGDE